ncbi:MAG: hypothetical protein UT28_C0001G0431 [Berkelbacteria bacterium GW2011_GWE1_39_12]|uniref:Extracellular solute-binding protein n=1 Tax=Berkelbacteria bacterium GW2011_GWE1_39_12 TaxID=1618337 RepID=A0A0G4B5I6_9BACT|nr:MAG: hypothetical protein UT28_C0001G0431 [Berkelbacteria bacterium GW2011_GWE1_39_12]
MNNMTNAPMNTDGSNPGLGGLLKGRGLVLTGAGLLIVILIIVVIVIGSSGGKKTATTVKSSNSLVIWGTEPSANFDGLITNFQSKNTGYKITYVQKDSSTYLTDSLNAISSGTGPDVWAVPNTWMAKYHTSMIPMTTDLIADKKAKKTDADVYKTLFPKVIVQDNIIADKIYGIPMSIDNLVLFYNKTILTKTLNEYFAAGNKDLDGSIAQMFTTGPKSWDDFVKLSKMVTKKEGSNITQSAIALGTPDNVRASADILTLLMLQDGAKMVSSNLDSANFANAENVFNGQQFPGAQALNFYTAFANPGNSLYTWNSSITDSLHAFANGQTAMMIDYLAATTDVSRINPNANIGTFSVPQVKETSNPVDYSSYITYTVPKSSPNSVLAWQFINFIANSASTTAYTSKTQSQPVLLSSITSNSARGKRIINSQTWYMPDPVLTPPILKNAIKQVNDGKNAQTAIEYAASQVTDLLKKLKN